MKLDRKNLIIFIAVIGSIIPIIFGYNWNYIFVPFFDLLISTVLFIGIFAIFLLGRVIISKIYNESSISQMEEHDLLKAFSNQNKKSILIVFFPMTMLMEELIFRFYAISILLEIFYQNFLLSILLSSIIFAFYHLHFWFRFKNFRIFISYFILSFFLGVLNGFIFLYFGLLYCFIVHFGLAFEMYHHLYRKYFKKNNGKT